MGLTWDHRVTNSTNSLCPGSIAITIFFARSWTAFDYHSRAEVKRTFDLNITRAFTCKSIIVGGRHGCAPSKISASRQFGSNRNPASMSGIVRADRNPNGIPPQSPGLRGTSNPGIMNHQPHNPNGVANNQKTKPMPQSLSMVYIHLVFSTKDRRPFLRDPRIRPPLHAYLGEVSKRLDCPPILVGGVEDHVHLLARFGRTITQAEWVKEVKRVSNQWLKEQGLISARALWMKAHGYA